MNEKKSQPQKAPKRSPAQMDADAVIIEKYSLEGYTLKEIAAKLAEIRPYKLSGQTIHVELKKLQEQWQEEAKASIDQHVARMLKELYKIKKELWKAWRRSQKDFESYTVKHGVEGISKERKREQRDGQVAFVNSISDVNAQIRELLGLDKPKKTALTDAEGKESFQPLVVNIAPEHLPKVRKDNKE